MLHKQKYKWYFISTYYDIIYLFIYFKKGLYFFYLTNVKLHKITENHQLLK